MGGGGTQLACRKEGIRYRSPGPEEKEVLMISFLVIVYTAVVLVLFKMKFVKPRPMPIALMVLVGVLLLGGIIIAWVMCAPMSGRVVTFQYVVQLVPYVKGQVLKIHAQANQPMKKGDLLLEINPEPYQFTFDQVQAQLQSAKDNVGQTTAGLAAAQANVAKSKAGIDQSEAAVVQAKASVANASAAVQKAKAQDDLAITEEKIAVSLQKVDVGAISELKVAKAVQNRQAADASLKQAQAGLGEAQAGLGQADAALAGAKSAFDQAQAAERQAQFALQMAKSNVVALQSQLDDARFNLTQCKMYAPGDGYVVNWQVQEGTMLVPMPLVAAGTFINTSETFVAASFPQNYLMNVEPGDDVELIINTYPGRLFKAKVDTVIPATGEGQYDPSKQIPLASKVGSQGLLAVKIRFVDETVPLPLGAGGTVAIYTKEGKPVHIISKVTIRMKKWLLYLLPA
jgi:multidrug resistance efflux pump